MSSERQAARAALTAALLLCALASAQVPCGKDVDCPGDEVCQAGVCRRDSTGPAGPTLPAPIPPPVQPPPMAPPPGWPPPAFAPAPPPRPVDPDAPPELPLDPAPRLEAGLGLGLTANEVLVEHRLLEAHAGYFVTPGLALEARAFFNVGGERGLAAEMRDSVTQTWRSVRFFGDTRAGWRAKLGALAGVRWAPLRGRVWTGTSFTPEVAPYARAALGFAQAEQGSVTVCTSGSATGHTCDAWDTRQRLLPLGALGLGLEVRPHPKLALTLEVRALVLPDSWRTDVPAGPVPQGTDPASVGTEHATVAETLFQLSLGVAFVP